MKLTINQEYAKLVPVLADTEYETLKESIKQNGMWLPIIANSQGVILDGHHRFKICQELGIQIRHAVRDFATKTDEIIFVGESNLKRRQLTSLQRIDLVRRLEPYYAEQSKQNQGTRTDLNIKEIFPEGQRRDKLGEKAQVSGRTYDKGATILDKASPTDIDKINNGQMTISKVYRNITNNEKKSARHAEIKELQVNLPETVTLHNQEFQSAPIPDNSVSLILTDPPYHEKYLYLYDDLGRHAAKVLRNGGSLICYAGHYAIGKIINMMEAHGLKFHWPIAVIHSGPSASVFGRKILVGYKPMLWFVKGKYEGEFVRDIIQSEFQGKELHEWAQSTKESDYYIKYLTIENEIVYDPFMGQGTFGISAVSQKRQFIGCEVDPEHFANAQKIISEATP